MDYIILAQTLIPAIVITIAAKFIISSQDKQMDALLSLVNHQEEDIASLKASIDKEMEKQLAKAEYEYDNLDDDDSDY